MKQKLDDWIGGWAKLADALCLIFTLGQFNPRLNYKWYFSLMSRRIINKVGT